MKRKSTGIAVGAALLLLALSAPVANGAAGDLDLSFGSGGIKTLPGSTYDHAFQFAAADMAMYNGRAVVLGTVDGGDFGLSKPLANGNPDPAYGSGGLARIDFGGTDVAVAVAVQANGMTAAAGNTDSSTAAVAHYNADGTPDTFFGGDGTVTVPLNPGEVVTDVAEETSGRIALSIDTPGAGGQFKVIVLDGSGALDTTFNGSGDASVNVGPGEDSALTLGFQSTGNLVVAGREGKALALTHDNTALVRFDTNGTPDTSFNGTGKLAIDYANAARDDFASALAIAPDDSIVVTGDHNDAGGVTGGTMKLSADGVLDGTFGFVDFISGGDILGRHATDVAVGPDGRVVVWGVKQEAGMIGQLQRLGTNGIEDFRDEDTGDNTPTGTFSYDLPAPAGVAVDSDNSIVIAGAATEQPTGMNGSFVQRWSGGATPAPDNSFGGDGTAFLRLSEARPAGTGLLASVAGPGGTFYSSGIIQADDDRFALLVTRQLADGNLDPSFGSGGRAIAAFGSAGDDIFAGSLAVQPDGKIVADGTLHRPSPSDYTTIVARFNTDGTLDSNFDGPGIIPGNGAFELDLGGDTEQGETVAIDGLGRIVLLGETNSVNAGKTDPYLARLTSDGHLDTGFGSNGVLIDSIGPGFAGAAGLVVQPDGKLVFGASDSTTHDFTVSRVIDLSGTGDTSFDPGFGTGGHVSQPGITTSQVGRDLLALQPDGKIVHTGVDGNDFGLVRYTAAGVPDTSFSGDGRQTIDFGGGDYASDISLQPGGPILVTGYLSTGGFAMARVTAAGELDSSFSGDGKVVTDLGGAANATTFGPVTAEKATLIGQGPAEDITLARYLLTTAPQTAAPLPATPVKKKCKKKKKKHATAAKKKKCKKKKKK